MKLLVDLFPCQTVSRFRGIGRYTHSLVLALASTRKSHSLVTLANAAYHDSFETLRREFTGLLNPGSFLPYKHIDINPDYGENDPNFDVASTLVRHAYETVNADIILYPSIFEGWGEKGVVPLPINGFPSALRSVIIYDFIPYVYAERFLEPDPYFKSFYLKRLEVLKKFDLLLAISESTRQDAIKFLDLPPERVVNISAATNAVFQKKNYTNHEVDALLWRFRITKPFIFYTGNVEYHKNMEKALQAYSSLPEEIRRSHQFVLTHTGDELTFRNKLHSMGLNDHEVLVTGHISDQELVALYNCCKLFVFPSLYEGFGLPILEAMACGAPVIASNNSSIPEVMGREDAMFDGSSELSIRNALHKALTDDTFRQNLSSYGLERVKQFSWEKSARKAWQAMEEVQEKSRGERRVHATCSGVSAKPKIAFVSPLPPQKSGIADYSVDLLPYLSRHVEVDLFTETEEKITGTFLNKKYSIYPWSELINRQKDYETVIYQVGNSKFHRYMFQLIGEIPGVVVLHDFFLSHLREFMYSTRYLDNPHGNFHTEAGEQHGMTSIVDFIQRGLDKSIWDWPFNWKVLRDAKEIIVHSEYQNTLIKKFYGRGWHPRPTVIKQMHRIENIVSPQEKMSNKQILGINQEHFTFCSFGYLNTTKLNFLTIEAFARYLTIDDKANLVFIGEIEQGNFERGFWNLCDHLGVSKQVRVTGFADNETFKRFLTVTDTAIQLRVNSRGETSRAVLDCMAFGIPTIVNAHGSLNDYSEGDVLKLNETPDIDELVEAMVRLRKDASFREKIGQNARNAISMQHHPEQVAAAYFDVIQEASQKSDRVLFAPLIDAAVKSESLNEILQSSSRFAASNLCLRNQSRILIDVTNISYTDLRTGIQRVVKNIIRELFAIPDPCIHLELTKISEGKLLRSSRFAERLFDLPVESLGEEVSISIQPGDTLFMLDTSWNLFDQFIPVFDQVRKAGGRIYTMLYDMIPLKFPEYCTGPTVEFFKKWIDRAIFESDEIVCISNAVAADVEAHIREFAQQDAYVCDVSYIHLGADIPVAREEAEVRQEVRNLVDNPTLPLFLMVGTIEPRKGHAFAMDAFEHLWHQGDSFRLCIIGKMGWNVAELEQRIRTHPELGNRFFFIEDATDAEINLCYSAGTALVTSSVAEGFGLPIVEAALHHIPVLASDIPVFREVGGDGAVYFSLESPVCLAVAIQQMAAKTPEERAILAKKVKCLSWKESAAWVLDILERKR